MASASAKVRLTIRVSQTTNKDVRALLRDRKMRRGELSKFVEEAVQRQLFRVMVDDIQLRNATVDKGRLQADIDRAVKEVRAESKMRPQRRKNASSKTIAVA
jgi:hypothetical protein